MKDFSLKTIGDKALDTFTFKDATIGDIINAAMPLIFFAAGGVLLVMIVLSGLQLMTAAGDQKAAAGARTRLTHALIGFIIVFISFWLVQAIGIILGLSDISAIFGG